MHDSDFQSVYGLEVKTKPQKEPVTTEEARAHCKIDHTDEDSYLDSLVAAARQKVELETGRSLINTVWTMTLDEFGPNVSWWPRSFLASEIVLPRSPVQSVDEIRYIDDSGVQQTLAASDYRVDTSRIRARITPAYAETWPTTRPITKAVEIDFTAGYGADPGDVPEALRHAIKIMVYTWYEPVRAGVALGTIATRIPDAADALMGPYRVGRVGGA